MPSQSQSPHDPGYSLVIRRDLVGMILQLSGSFHSVGIMSFLKDSLNSASQGGIAHESFNLSICRFSANSGNTSHIRLINWPFSVASTRKAD